MHSGFFFFFVESTSWIILFQVYFGQNMVCMDSVADGKGMMIKVGDPVYVHKEVRSCADAPAWTLDGTQEDIYT